MSELAQELTRLVTQMKRCRSEDLLSVSRAVLERLDVLTEDLLPAGQ